LLKEVEKDLSFDRYYLNTITGEVIDAKWQSLCDFRAKTKNWPKVIVPISEKVYEKLQESRKKFEP